MAKFQILNMCRTAVGLIKANRMCFLLIQFSSVTQSCLTLGNPTDYSTPGFSVHHQLQEFAQTHVHGVNNVIQPSHSLLSTYLPVFSLSQHQGLLQWVSSSSQGVKVLALQSWSWLRMSPSNEYSGLISFRMDWLDLLAVQGTLKSLLQHRISKASILQHSAFFMVQLSYPYMTTGKIIAFDYM